MGGVVSGIEFDTLDRQLHYLFGDEQRGERFVYGDLPQEVKVSQPQTDEGQEEYDPLPSPSKGDERKSVFRLLVR